MIALVITIVVLLILAGVTISTLSGENGLLNRSKIAKEKYRESASLESLNIKLAEIEAEYYSEFQTIPTFPDLVSAFQNQKESKVEIIYYNYEKLAFVSESANDVISDNIKNIQVRIVDYPEYSYVIGTRAGTNQYEIQYFIDKNGNANNINSDTEEPIEEPKTISYSTELTDWLSSGSIELTLEDVLSSESLIVQILSNETAVDKLVSDSNALYVIANNDKIKQNCLDNKYFSEKIKENLVDLDKLKTDNYIELAESQESINSILVAAKKENINSSDLIDSENLMAKVMENQSTVDYMLNNEEIMNVVVESKIALIQINNNSYAKAEVSNNSTMVSKIENSSNSSYADTITMPENVEQKTETSSSSSKYFNTGYIPTLNTSIKCSMKCVGTTGISYFGFYAGADSNDYRIFDTGGTIYYDYMSSRYTWSREQAYGSADLWNTTYHVYEVGNLFLKIDGKTLLDTDKYTSGQLCQTGITIGGEPSGIVECDFKYFQIYEGSQLVRDYIPVSQNGVNTLYDRITRTTLIEK